MDTQIVDGADIPIVKLIPIRKRTIDPKKYQRLKANLQAVGLIEPLCVCKEGKDYYILDGYIRYQVFLEMGIQSVPCLVLKTRDLYTPNRQVNGLSAKEEVKMLRKALEKLDEKTIAKAFGLEALGARLNCNMYRDLHPKVLAALNENKITQQTAKELTYVIDKRQEEILNLMEKCGDCSHAFVTTQILNTPASQRTKKKKRNPWDLHIEKKRSLATRLAEAEKHHDFYSSLYRKYMADILKLSIYIRQIVNHPVLQKYLEQNHPEPLQLFRAVLLESEGRIDKKMLNTQNEI